jgi:hypothetical protein
MQVSSHNAILMYTNIDIDDCLEHISQFLLTIWDKTECAAIIQEQWRSLCRTIECVMGHGIMAGNIAC